MGAFTGFGLLLRMRLYCNWADLNLANGRPLRRNDAGIDFLM
jgi:hypothetical protein